LCKRNHLWPEPFRLRAKQTGHPVQESDEPIG